MKTGANRNIMIMNTYFHQDPKSSTFDSMGLLSTLADIQNTTNKNDFNEFIWTGDINTDFRRKTRFVEIVECYVNDNIIPILGKI